MATQSSVNFHHPSGRKFLLSFSNHVWSYEAFRGYSADKGHGNKVAVSEAKFCPPLKAAHLASLSAFQFPQTVVVSPYGAFSCA
jgi:hypothetical protein